MYSSLYNLCNSRTHIPRVITTNTHFLKPHALVYGEEERTQCSRLDFAPEMWGAGAWEFLFTVAKAYDPHPSYTQRLQMRRFLESLTYCLPCKKCRCNFSDEVLELEESDLDSPEKVRSWLEKLRIRISKRKKEDE